MSPQRKARRISTTRRTRKARRARASQTEKVNEVKVINCSKKQFTNIVFIQTSQKAAQVSWGAIYHSFF